MRDYIANNMYPQTVDADADKTFYQVSVMRMSLHLCSSRTCLAVVLRRGPIRKKYW